MGNSTHLPAGAKTGNEAAIDRFGADILNEQAETDSAFISSAQNPYC